MRKQSIIILSLIAVGTLFGAVYGAGTIISDTGITTPALTVSGACTGCDNEPSFTSWSTVLNQTVAGTSNRANSNIFTSTNGTVFFLDQNADTAIVKLDGTVVTVTHTPANFINQGSTTAAQSSSGKYKIIETTGAIVVYKNNVLTQTLGIDVSQFQGGFLGNEGISISADGKYISLQGKDSGGVLDRVIIFGGS